MSPWSVCVCVFPLRRYIVPISSCPSFDADWTHPLPCRHVCAHTCIHTHRSLARHLEHDLWTDDSTPLILSTLLGTSAALVESYLYGVPLPLNLLSSSLGPLSTHCGALLSDAFYRPHRIHPILPSSLSCYCPESDKRSPFVSAPSVVLRSRAPRHADGRINNNNNSPLLLVLPTRWLFHAPAHDHEQTWAWSDTTRSPVLVGPTVSEELFATLSRDPASTFAFVPETQPHPMLFDCESIANPLLARPSWLLHLPSVLIVYDEDQHEAMAFNTTPHQALQLRPSWLSTLIRGVRSPTGQVTDPFAVLLPQIAPAYPLDSASVSAPLSQLLSAALHEPFASSTSHNSATEPNGHHDDDDDRGPILVTRVLTTFPPVLSEDAALPLLTVTKLPCRLRLVLPPDVAPVTTSSSSSSTPSPRPVVLASAPLDLALFTQSSASGTDAHHDPCLDEPANWKLASAALSSHPAPNLLVAIAFQSSLLLLLATPASSSVSSTATTTASSSASASTDSKSDARVTTSAHATSPLPRLDTLDTKLLSNVALASAVLDVCFVSPQQLLVVTSDRLVFLDTSLDVDGCALARRPLLSSPIASLTSSALHAFLHQTLSPHTSTTTSTASSLSTNSTLSTASTTTSTSASASWSASTTATITTTSTACCACTCPSGTHDARAPTPKPPSQFMGATHCPHRLPTHSRLFVSFWLSPSDSAGSASASSVSSSSSSWPAQQGAGVLLSFAPFALT